MITTPQITILSVGPGDPGLVNEKTKQALVSSDRVILRTGRHELAAVLREQGIPFRTMDSLYDAAESFDELSDMIAGEVWKEAGQGGAVVYAVPDALSDRSVEALYKKRPESGTLRSIPGFSFSDYYLSACRGFFPTSDIRICTAADFEASTLDPSRPVLITELNDAITAGEIKNALSLLTDDEDTVYFLHADSSPLPIPLFELDRQPEYSHLSAVAVPGTDALHRKGKTFRDLIMIMDLLRSQEGCPWDRKQSHETLRPYLVEEAWEAVDAIDRKDPLHMAEELGDLLFQIVFHASIGETYDEFTMTDIITGICDKMVRRHPHVFLSDRKPDEFSEAAWDRIKQAEQGSQSLADSLRAVSSALPSLRYAEKVIRKIMNTRNGHFPEDSMLSELCIRAEQLRNADQDHRDALLGRILFLCAMIAQLYGTDSEVILHETVKKVIDGCESFEKNGKTGMISSGLLDF